MELRLPAWCLSFFGQIRRRAVEASQRIDLVNRWVFRHWINYVQIIAGFELVAIGGLAVTMINLSEYAAAELFWILATFVWVIKILSGKINRLKPTESALLLAGKAIGVFVLAAIVITLSLLGQILSELKAHGVHSFRSFRTIWHCGTTIHLFHRSIALDCVFPFPQQGRKRLRREDHHTKLRL